MAVGLWSCAGIATGFTSGLAGLVRLPRRAGRGRSRRHSRRRQSDLPISAPAERALGNALNQAGVSLGMLLAPPLATWIALRFGWRQAFVVTGALGLLWIPRLELRAGPPRRAAAAAQTASAGPRSGLLRDRRLWAFVAGQCASA